MFSADKEHIHHQLLKLGYTHRRAVLLMYALCAFFAIAALGVTYANGPQVAGILIVVSAVVFLIVRKLGYLDLMRTQGLAGTRRKNLALRSAVNDIGDALRTACDYGAIWACVQRIAEPLALAGLTLCFEAPEADPSSPAQIFQLEVGAPPAPNPLQIVLLLENEGVRHGELRAQWGSARVEIGRDDELALELLVDHVNRALPRCHGGPARLRVVSR